jgi:DNA-binding NtrC family response regulator
MASMAHAGMNRQHDEPKIITASKQMKDLFAYASRVAVSDAKVLITGESGVGKDIIARYIHAHSLRRTREYVAVNCAGVAESLLESELFGHVKGSFTGAHRDKLGKLQLANGGTLFLDELGEMSPRMQGVLLRFLENGEIHPVGSDMTSSSVNVRVIAATNRNLAEMVTAGQFREDLLYRVRVIHLHVPPLRDRREEIPHLSTFFLREACERLGKPGVRLSADTLDLFDTFPWPGNVRQLRNEVQRAVAMAPPAGLITPELLSAAFGTRGLRVDTNSPSRHRQPTLAAAVEKIEREMIQAALQRASGNISESARLLGLTRRGLYLKMERLGVEPTRPLG